MFIKDQRKMKVKEVAVLDADSMSERSKDGDSKTATMADTTFSD
jgi:hypothetical protein